MKHPVNKTTGAGEGAGASPRARRWQARWAARWGLRALLVWAGVEIPACLATGELTRRGLVYPVRDMSGFAAYTEGRDPVLGWSRPRAGSPEEASVDESGARKLPAFPDTSAPPCISMYGDSFTWSAEVADEHTWGNFLARQAGCRVTSFGVSGYGTDQAYLRYLHRREDGTKIVLFGVFSADIMRNVNQYRALHVSQMIFGLKPRFVLGEGGELRLIPVPLPDEAGMREIAENGGRDLPHEHFRTGTRDGLTMWRFPHALSLARLVSSRRAWEAATQAPRYAAFYDPGHPSGALAITAAIVRAFEEEAARRGAFGGVVIIPAWDDLAEHRRSGRWIYQPLLDALAASKTPVLDAGARFAEVAGAGDFCSYYTGCTQGHLTPVGNRKLGEVTFRWLKELGKL